MAQRLRFFDLRISRLPQAIGLCADDVPRLAQAVNAAQQRLLYAKEAGDEGWWGTWAEIVFNVSRASPHITLPREIARLESVDMCQRPVAVQNQFFEYLEFGNGRLPKTFRHNHPCRPIQVLSRNNAVTFADLTKPPQYIVVYPTNQADIKKRVLIQGYDNNNVRVVSQDTFQTVDGIFVSLQIPFVNAPVLFNSITGIQKDVTFGPVQIFQLDPSTGAQVLLLTMEPSETTAWYRRYYLDHLPNGCCPAPVSLSPCTTFSQIVQVTAIAKLDLVPVSADTDYCLIQNQEAIIHECEAVRYSGIDTSSAKQMEAYHHGQAIRLLNGELTHYLGTQQIAVNFAPFGSAKLEHQAIGTMT